MRKVDLQQQAVKLVRQLSTENEKPRAAVDYLVHLQGVFCIGSDMRHSVWDSSCLDKSV